MTDVHALSGAYAIDALDGDERTRFAEHLVSCLDCREEVRSLREAGALLSLTATIGAADGLRERVLADISLVRPLPPRVGSRRATSALVTELDSRRLRVRRGAAPVRGRRWPALVAAAAVVVGVGVGIVVPDLGDRDGTPPSATPTGDGGERAAQDDSVVAARVLAAPDAETHARALEVGGSVTVSRSVELDRAVVLTQALPTAPRGTTYQTWLRVEGRMVPAGLMAGGQSAVVLVGDAARAEAVGITVEPAGGSPRPTAQPIAYFPLDGV